ncbi:MAG: YchJ family protein [Pseudomonadota bacterium]
MNDTTACPCGSGRPYESCCGPLISGTTSAPDPEALMRSRYTAFARLEMPYLASSLDPSQRHDYDESGATRWARESDWQKLEIINVTADPENANRGSVEFRAHYRMQGEQHVHHELAEFRKTGDTWYFYDGKMVSAGQFTRETPKVGRNDPCPCGSGKKYKKCCG